MEAVHTSIREAVSEYHSSCYTLSPSTQRNHRQRLGKFVEWCEESGLTLASLRARHIRDFLDDVSKHPGQKTPLVRRSTLRSYAQTIKAWLNWLGSEEDFADIVSPRVARIALPKSDQDIIQVFTIEQVTALFEAASKQPYSVRDTALLAFLLDTGARASEVCSLTLNCLWLDANDSYAKLMGKGRKEREVPIGRACRTMLRRYVSRYRKPANKGEQHVFLAGNTGKPITRSGLHQIIATLGRKAGIKGVRVSPHTCRHFFATQYLLNNGSIYDLKLLMGHSELRVTEKYAQTLQSKQVRQPGHQSVLDHLKDL